MSGVSDEAVALLAALEQEDVIASGMDAAGYGYALQGIATLEDQGWTFKPPPETDARD